ncbi:MAG: hypothetical protein JWM16_1245 [Verrucomicrobiales bacterium]|nr:hypothetical protein [Verrucomicrobiales bacterium]
MMERFGESVHSMNGGMNDTNLTDRAPVDKSNEGVAVKGSTKPGAITVTPGSIQVEADITLQGKDCPIPILQPDGVGAIGLVDGNFIKAPEITSRTRHHLHALANIDASDLVHGNGHRIGGKKREDA